MSKKKKKRKPQQRKRINVNTNTPQKAEKSEIIRPESDNKSTLLRIFILIIAAVMILGIIVMPFLRF